MRYFVVFIIAVLTVYSCSNADNGKTRHVRLASIHKVIDSLTRNSGDTLQLDRLQTLQAATTNREDLAAIALAKAKVYGSLGDFRRSLDEAKEAQTFFDEQTNDPPSQISARLLAAKALLAIENNDKALALALEANGLARESTPSLIPETCLLLAGIYEALGNETKEKEWIFAGLANAQTPEDRYLFNNKISRFYTAKGEIDSALFYFNRVLAQAGPMDDFNVGARLFNKGALYVRKKDFLTGLKYYDSSKPYFLRTTIGSSFYYNYAVVMRKLHRFKEAAQYNEQALLAVQKETKNRKSMLSDLWLQRARIFADRNDYQNAYLTMDSFKDAQVDFFEEQMMQAAQDAEAKFNLKEKETSIKTLTVDISGKEQALRKYGYLLWMAALVLAAGFVITVLLIKQKTLKARNEQIALEQRLLRSQMNPHFMFNALSAIQSEILEGNTRVANKYLNEYAALMRLILENSASGFVPLVQEIKAVNNYVSLQQLRYGDKFDYTFLPYDGLEQDSLLIPPMLVQPFIENAIEHGMRGISYKGAIVFKVEKTATHILCIIADNGHGLTEKKHNDKKSLSTDITRQRLQWLAKELGQEAGITFGTTNESGHTVLIKIPYRS